MPVVNADLFLADADLQRVWDVVADFASYPALMPNVLSIDILERSGDTAVSAWRTLLDGTEMSWEERDTFEPCSRISFEQIDGDLELFRGAWTLTGEDGGVRVQLSMEFDIGIPSLAAVLNPLGVQAIRANSMSMLNAIGERLSALEPVA
jgi:ribosome-associated toxin RatA of RatAB toxin-antitoxin module